jgi:exosortase
MTALGVNRKLLVGGLLGLALLWSYGPTIRDLVKVWTSVADYSHGFLVVPAAILILWFRRAGRPTIDPRFHPEGLILIVVAAILRWISARYFVDAVDGWSLVVWIAGATWFLYGWPVLRWALPGIFFLLFMVPLPYRAETAVSLPLQRIATSGSSWVLQTLGQPALPEGTTIVLGDVHLEIQQACAGLRMFVGVLALAYVIALFSCRNRWERALLLLASIPAAVLANVLRITATALLYQQFADHSIRERIHDSAGLFTIFVGAALLASAAWYLKRLIRKVELGDPRSLFETA